MDRREFLAGSAVATTAGAAGCLDAVLGDSPGATDDVVLDTTDRYDSLRESRDRGALSNPIHADELPGVTLPDALSGRDISTRGYVGDRHVLLTFVFTRCSQVCPGLAAKLAAVQADAREQGYADEFAYMPVTFDPGHDTPERLRQFCANVGAVYEADNWHALRPADRETAATVVGGQFGVASEYVPESEREMDNMAWTHTSSIVLANADGYVERNYFGPQMTGAPNIIQDVRTLRGRW